MRKGNLTHFPNVTFQNLTYLSLTSNALTSLETVPLGVLVPNIEYLDLSINTIEYIEVSGSQGSDDGGHNSPGAESLWGVPIIPTMSQVLSSMQYICFRKCSGSNMGALSLLLASGAI